MKLRGGHTTPCPLQAVAYASKEQGYSIECHGYDDQVVARRYSHTATKAVYAIGPVLRLALSAVHATSCRERCPRVLYSQTTPPFRILCMALAATATIAQQKARFPRTMLSVQRVYAVFARIPFCCPRLEASMPRWHCRTDAALSDGRPWIQCEGRAGGTRRFTSCSP